MKKIFTKADEMGLVFFGTKLIETRRLTDPGDSDEE